MFKSNRKTIRIGSLLLTCTAATAVGVGASQVASAAPPAPTIKEISCTLEKPGGGKLAGESVVHWDHIPHDQGIFVDAGWVANTPSGKVFLAGLEDPVLAHPAGSIRLDTPEPNEGLTDLIFSVQFFKTFEGPPVLQQSVDCR